MKIGKLGTMSTASLLAICIVGLSASAVAADNGYANVKSGLSEAKTPATPVGTAAAQDLVAVHLQLAAGAPSGYQHAFYVRDGGTVHVGKKLLEAKAAGDDTKTAKAPMLAAGSPHGTGDVATADDPLLIEVSVDVNALFKAEASNVALVDTKKAVAEAKDYACYSEPTKNASSDKVAGTGAQYGVVIAQREYPSAAG